ncbi:restriction endonuclease [Trabulsiella odontotermitis]|uniref:restriction endonuclease n=1 Tax=Trabulsiella odontotermitis TaxID=379893 RepID=UPI0006BA2D48|nr:restriction endonuclease [Trabulsiella odontotermitis]
MTAKTIVDAAINALNILERAAYVTEIYEEIISYNLYAFGAKDPKSVLRITLDRHCINKNLGIMHQSRHFVKLSDGRYGLISQNVHFSDNNLSYFLNKAEPVDTSALKIHELASLQRERVRKEIIEGLRELSAEQFEDFCRIFLTKYGFLKMNLTRRGRDGGIDVTGLLKAGLASMRVAVQCKKYSAENKVGRSAISAFRGDITGEYEQGIFITTSSYTKDAENISFKPSCVPIVLIDGEQLADFMIDKRIGVQTKLIELYDFERDLLWE